jgi:hypothetical protein
MLLVLSPLAFAWGADEPKHNTLTPQEIADGWILLWDGETTFGWNVLNESKWTILDGLLAPQAEKPGLLVTTTPFRDYELALEYQTKQDSKADVLIGCDKDGQGGMAVPANATLGSGWTHLRITVRNGIPTRADYRQGLGGAARREFPKPAAMPFDASKSFLALAGNGVVLRDVKLRPANTKSLFNGKNLSGWKKFETDEKRAKSEFSVTKEGWINIKNGPGDLQTEGQYDDFLLQIECISNGKHLNSGVFFRCRPGEYQQGYEAQIHNGWTEKPEKEYIVEEYDPKTNELKEKKKVMSASMDYGTGAIYRRVPARKAVAKDNEWFTMTVAAHGRHIATWVNGQQVVDWTDNRPLKDNARNGCRLEKGNISLQGHDPTTDLSFRNIRIAELTAKEKEKDEKKE